MTWHVRDNHPGPGWWLLAVVLTAGLVLGVEALLAWWWLR